MKKRLPEGPPAEKLPVARPRVTEEYINTLPSITPSGIPEPVEEEFNFESDLKIDKFSLDFECIDQPSRFHRYATLWAQAVKERDKAKQELKVIKAQVISGAKSNPSILGLDKWADSSGMACVEGHPKVVEAVSKLIRAEKKELVLSTAVDAFRDRKALIGNLVQLYLSGYWSDVKMPRETADKLSGPERDKQIEFLNRNRK